MDCVNKADFENNTVFNFFKQLIVKNKSDCRNAETNEKLENLFHKLFGLPTS